MMRLKTLLSLLLLWLMTAGVMAAEEQSTLLVLLKDGSEVRFVLPTQKPEVSFSHGNMRVDYLTDTGMETYMSFERAQVLSLRIRKAEEDAIKSLPSDDVQRIQFDLMQTGMVRVNGLKKDDRLQVYSLDGKSVDASVVRQDGEATVDLSQQRRGVYLVSVNQRFTFKLMKP